MYYGNMIIFTFTASLVKAVLRKPDKFRKRQRVPWIVALVEICKDNANFHAFSATGQRTVLHHLNAWMVKEFSVQYCPDDLNIENSTVSCIVGAGNLGRVWKHDSGLNRCILELNCNNFLQKLAYKAEGGLARKANISMNILRIGSSDSLGGGSFPRTRSVQAASRIDGLIAST